MAGKPTEYHRGEMDIHEQRSTYHSFLVMSKWGALIIMVGLLFFSLLFAVGVGFTGAAGAAIVLGGLGFALLREKRKSGH